MNLFPLHNYPVNKVKRFIVTFYIVGVIGFYIPWTRELFITITPLALLLNTYLLAKFHRGYNSKQSIAFLLIFLLGYFVEVIGVQSGAIFGEYQYGTGLGWKIWGTPLMIGLNWLFLTYITTAFLEQVGGSRWGILCIAPLLMVGYDLLVEQVAPKMDMWYWEGGTIPLQNYIAWYIVGFVMVAILQLFKIKTANSLAKTLFISQSLFFLILTLILTQ